MIAQSVHHVGAKEKTALLATRRLPNVVHRFHIPRRFYSDDSVRPGIAEARDSRVSDPAGATSS